MVKLVEIAVIVVIGLSMGQITEADECKKCQTNSHYCESETTYFICMDGEKKHGPYNCAADEVCTNSDQGCEKKSAVKDTIKNVCGDDNGSGCKSCPTGKKFTCASRTQAALCVGEKMSEKVIIDCAKDEVCVSEAETKFDNVCVPTCALNFTKLEPSCSNDVYTPTTLEPPTTPSDDDIRELCKKADVDNNKTKKYFFAYADSTCNSYVYCERSSLTSSFDNNFAGSCLNKSPNIYFNTASSSCQATKPDSCPKTP